MSKPLKTIMLAIAGLLAVSIIGYLFAQYVLPLLPQFWQRYLASVFVTLTVSASLAEGVAQIAGYSLRDLLDRSRLTSSAARSSPQAQSIIHVHQAPRQRGCYFAFGKLRIEIVLVWFIVVAGVWALLADLLMPTQHVAEVLARAYSLADQGQYEEAIELYGIALAKEPDNVEGYYGRGNAYAATGQYALAIEDFNRALELEPGNASIYLARANAFDAQGAYEEAMADFLQALQLDPELTAKAIEARADTHYQMGEYDLAREDYVRLLEFWQMIGSRSDEGRILYKLGLTRVGEGDYEQALELFKGALAIANELGDAEFESEVLAALDQLPTIVNITSPEDGATLVSYSTRVSGISHNVPEGSHIWILVQPCEVPCWYPQLGAIPIDANGNWSTVAYISMPSSTHCRSRISVVVVDAVGHQALEDLGSEDCLVQLPRGVVVYDSIEVRRND